MANKNSLSKAAASTGSKFFSGSESGKAIKDVSSVKNQLKEEKVPKQVFSFRGDKNDVKAWRLYANITGIKVDDLGSLAMKEYLENHPLEDIEKALFDERMK